MSHRYLTRLFCIVAVAVGIQFAKAAQAGISFHNEPAQQVVASIDQTYGMHIVLGPGIDRESPVTMQVSDSPDVDGRLNDIDYLAHALNAVCNKVLVLHIVAWHEAIAQPVIDSNGTVGFAHRTMPVREAVRMIALADGATVSIPHLSGTVHFSSLSMTAREAAAEVSRQTHTTWSTYYELLPRGAELASAGTVIGYTPDGAPITEGSILTPPEQPIRPSTRYFHSQSTRSSPDEAATVTTQPSANPVTVTPVPMNIEPNPAGGTIATTLPGSTVQQPTYWNPYTNFAAPGPTVSTLNPIQLYGYPYFSPWGDSILTTNGGLAVLPGFGPAFVISGAH